MSKLSLHISVTLMLRLCFDIIGVNESVNSRKGRKSKLISKD